MGRFAQSRYPSSAFRSKNRSGAVGKDKPDFDKSSREHQRKSGRLQIGRRQPIICSFTIERRASILYRRKIVYSGRRRYMKVVMKTTRKSSQSADRKWLKTPKEEDLASCR